jgi:hypothetical protein
MAFANLSRYAALDLPFVTHDGREVVVVIVKATFDIGAGGELTRAARQRPVRLADEVYDPDALDSSIRLPSDVCVAKGGCDVVVIGDAISPKPVKSLDVAVSVRDRSVPLRVHGERLFYSGVGGVVVGDASTFTRKPITYERAYGGTSEDFTVMERRNPVGRGVASSESDLVDTPAPQIEHPAEPMTRASDRPAPVGFGAIATHWLPRSDFAGTFDEAWQRDRMPLMPLNFDLRFNNCAHPSLRLDQPLVQGESVGVIGMHEDGVVQLEVPLFVPQVHARFDDGSAEEVRAPIDLLLLEPNDKRFELTARAAFPLGRGKRKLRELRVEGHG